MGLKTIGFMVRFKSTADMPDFKSSIRHAKGGLKDKQLGFFLYESPMQTYSVLSIFVVGEPR